MTTPQGVTIRADEGVYMTETRPSAWAFHGQSSSYTMDYYRLTLSAPGTDAWSMTTINESGAWDSFTISPGYFDYKEWFYAPASRQFQISATRFGHDLRIRQPHTTSEYSLTQQGTAGSVWQNGQVSYYYFDAEGYVIQERDFWIHDATTGEDAPLNTLNLATWLDLQPPSFDSATDNGLGNYTLNFRFNSDYATDVVLERRPEDGSGPWTPHATLALSGATYGSTYTWDIHVPAGESYFHRLRTAVGEETSVAYDCPDCCPEEDPYGYLGHGAKKKHFSWGQVFANGVALPSADPGSPDADGDGYVSKAEVENVQISFEPNPYPASLIDVSFGGGHYYAKWASTPPFALGSPAPEGTDRGAGFRWDQFGPEGVERNKTNDAPQGVNGTDLVTDVVQPAQDRLPSELKDYVKINKIIDNGNGEKLLAEADVFVRQGANEPAWKDATILLQDGNVKVVEMEGISPKQVCESDMLAGKKGGSAYGLMSAEFAIDADRDGLVEVGLERTVTPFRFWINEDHDHSELGDDMTGEANSSESMINGIRDLEDLTQLKFRLSPALIEMVKAGKAKLGIKWKRVDEGSPAVRVWTGSPNLETPQYLHDHAFALQTVQDNNLLVGGARLVSGTTTVWLRNDLMNDATGDTVSLLMEGVSPGTGRLTFVTKVGTQESEGGNIDLKLLQVRRMYERGKITVDAPDIPDPWDNPNPAALNWTWDPWNWAPDVDPNADKKTIVWVHGWRMNYDEYIQWADTTFKRLWQLGYKGRFYAFRWPTYHGDNNGADPADMFAPGGATYNPSEYRAWLSGPALSNFVNGLPNANSRYLLAHSMGNVISGSALRNNMQVTRYALCNAAMAGMAYDGNLAPDNPDNQTPDTDPDFGTQQTFGLSNKFNLGVTEMVNFCLPNDYALDKWSANNSLCKPQVFPDGTYYFYSAANAAGTKLKYLNWNPTPRFITSVPEAMGYVTASRTRAAGARLDTGGSIITTVNMGEYGFGTDHSAEWVYPIQKCYLFWRRAAEEFNVQIGQR